MIEILFKALCTGLPIVIGLYMALDMYFSKILNKKDIKGFFLDTEYKRKLDIICRIEHRERPDVISTALKKYIDQYETENNVNWDIWP